MSEEFATPDTSPSKSKQSSNKSEENMNSDAQNGNKIDFSLQNLYKHFNECIRQEDGAILTDQYLQGYDEIYKFLCLLGTVFGWVGSDVDAKVKFIRGKRDAKDTSSNYETIQSMIEHEKSAGLIKVKAKDCATGTRNLLRLHRALEYVAAFLETLPDMPEDEKCCPASQEAYKTTLMKYHPWVVQKGALAAMRWLPTKEGLIYKICEGNDAKKKETEEMFPKAVVAMKEVYDKTQELYKTHGYLDLP